MTQPIAISVTVRGPLFEKKINQVVQKAIVERALQTIGKRLKRKKRAGPGSGLGVRRNIVTAEMAFGLGAAQAVSMDIATTKNWPRTKGTSWQRENVKIARGMAPRVLKGTARKIVADLS